MEGYVREDLFQFVSSQQEMENAMLAVKHMPKNKDPDVFLHCLDLNHLYMLLMLL